jgi:uncharacterized protein YbaA (DUF1428 family)
MVTAWDAAVAVGELLKPIEVVSGDENDLVLLSWKLWRKNVARRRDEM